YMEEVKKYFKPEFINRIDEIVVFNALDDVRMNKIAHKFMGELIHRLSNKDIDLEVSDAVYQQIASEGVDPVYGARPMKRYIQREIETLIARLMMEATIHKEDHILLDVSDDKYFVKVK
ncbi:MAG: type VI secretion system ATPase TssH, partial [Erysipelotrichaceae bacterium]